MPIYSIQAPNGKTYQIEGPAGASQDQVIAEVLRQNPDAGQAIKAAPSSLKDIATSFGLGAVGSTKALTDVAGADNAASRALGDVSESLSRAYTPQRQAEIERRQQLIKEAEKTGSTWEEIKANLGSVAEAPLQSAAQGLGSIVPFALTGGAGSAAKLLPTTVKTINTLMGAAAGAGAVKGSIYDAVYDRLVQEGKPEDVARQQAVAAQEYLGANKGQIALGTGIGAAAGRYGVESLLAPGAAKAAEAQLGRRVGTALVGEMPLEGVQGGQERLAANVALQNQGYNVPTFEGVAGQAAQEAAMSGLAAGPVAAVRSPASEIQRKKDEEVKKLREERAATALEQQKAAEVEAARKQTPAYALDIEQQYLAAEQQRAALKAQMKPVVKDSPTAAADRAFNKDLTDQLKEASEAIKPLAKEYNAVQPMLAAAKEQQRLQAMSPEDVMLEQTMQGGKEAAPAPTGGRMKGALGVNEAPEAAPVDTTVQDYAAQQIEAAKNVGQFDLASLSDYLMEDPALAARVVAERPALEGMPKADATAVFTGLKLRLQEREKQSAAESKAELAARQEDLKAQKLGKTVDQMAMFKTSTEQVEEQRATGEPNFDYLDPVFEKAVGGKQPVVEVNPDIRPSDKNKETRTRVDQLTAQLDAKEQEYYSALRMNLGDKATKAYDESRAALAELNKLKGEGNVYASEIFSARKNQETALNEIEDSLDQVRSGSMLGKERGEVAASTKQSLLNRADQARAQYITSVLQEAATHRRAVGEQPLTQDEALKAAIQLNDTLTEWADRVQAAPRREALTEVTTPAQMRGTEIVRGAETRMADLRPLEKRRFGAYPQAVAVLKEQLDSIRSTLSEKPKTVATKESPLLKTQFATSEAAKVAEARGENADTLGGELRKHNEYVRNMMAKLDNSVITPRIQTVLNQAADVMDGGKPSRALLNAVEEVVGRLNSGRKVEMTDLRAIVDAIRAREETAPGQKSLDLLFEEPGKPARGIDKDLGYIRANAQNFANSPKVLKNALNNEEIAVKRWREGQQKLAEEKAKRAEEVAKLKEKAAAERAKTQQAYAERDAMYKAQNVMAAKLEEKRKRDAEKEKTRGQRLQEQSDAFQANREVVERQKELKRLQVESLKDEMADAREELGTKGTTAERKKELAQKIQSLQAQLDVLAEGKPHRKQAAATVKTEISRSKETPFRTGSEKTSGDTRIMSGKEAKKAGKLASETTSAQQVQLSDTAKEALDDGRLLDALDDVAANGSTPFIRDNAAALRKLVARTRVYVTDDVEVDGKQVPAAFNSEENAILIKPDALTEANLLHEATHAATIRALEGPETKLTADQLTAKQALQEMFDDLTADGTLTGEYASNNVKEFASEVQSNANLRDKLDNRSMLRKFFDYVMQLIGMKPEATRTQEAQDLIERLYMQSGKLDTKTLATGTPTYANDEMAAVGALTDKFVAKQKGVKDRVLAAAGGFLGLETQLVDRFAGFERLSKTMDALKGSQMMYYMRMYDQRMNFVSQAVENGALKLAEKERADGQKEYVIEATPGASIKGVVEILNEAKPMVGNGEAINRLFTMYMSGIRAKSKGFASLNFGKDVNPSDLDAAMKAVNGNAELKEIFGRAREEYNQYNRDMMEFLASTGAISEQTRKDLVKENDYIPWYRESNGVAELMIGGESRIRIGSIAEQPYLHELVGGDRPILDFMTSSVQNTNMLADMGLRNLAAKNAIFELVDMDMAKIVGASTGNNIVKFKVDGKDKYASVETDSAGIPGDLLVKGMQGIPTQMPAIFRVMSLPSRLLRKGVTLSPLYAAKQLFRDSLAAPILSGADFKPVFGALKEINQPSKELLERRGITGGQVFTGTSEDLTKILRDITDGKSGWLNALAKAEAIGMEADALTRRAQYNSYINQGLSEMEATLMALESMNFNKRGASPSIHIIGAMIPFFNAQIQGLNVLYKAMTGNMPFNERLRIQEKMLMRGGMLAAGTLAYAAMMQDDEAYKNATPEQKYGNWFVRIPGVDEPVRIPVPFEVGYIFKALPEALYNTMVDEHGGEEAVKAFKQILLQTIPGGTSYGIPQALKPAIEAGLGKSFYTGRDILSAHEKSLMPEEQFRVNTSEAAKLVGKGLGVSPVILEQLVQGYTGPMGLAFLQAASLGIPKGNTPEQATKRLSELPLVGGAFQPNDAGGIINATYDRFEDSMKVQRTVDKLFREGRQAEAKELLQKTGNEYAAGEMGDYFASQMKELTQYERAVQAMALTPDEKRQRLDEVKKLKIALAATARQTVDRTAPR